MAYGFIFSTEYKEKHTSNTEFATMLYHTMMDREPDEAGLTDWVDKLNYTNTREYVFNGFLFSTEFARRCAASGINIGNAVETPDATDAWQMNMQILALCNEQRQNNGLEKLMTREDLWGAGSTGACRGDCGLFFSHIRPNGKIVFHFMRRRGWITVLLEKILRAGYNGASARWWMAG